MIIFDIYVRCFAISGSPTPMPLNTQYKDCPLVTIVDSQFVRDLNDVQFFVLYVLDFKLLCDIPFTM